MANIPVYSAGGGDFNTNYPLKEGDTGWILACDRDISLYLQSEYEMAPPNTERLHSYSDAVFFPDIMDDYTINGADEGRAVFQHKSGATAVSIGIADIILRATLTQTSADLQALGKFGCNGAAPQPKFTIDVATGPAGNNTAVINQICAALIANGIGQ